MYPTTIYVNAHILFIKCLCQANAYTKQMLGIQMFLLYIVVNDSQITSIQSYNA